jgi:spore coat polysaccharide biosynthesis predicted glycosyltransferase SpsG
MCVAFFKVSKNVEVVAACSLSSSSSPELEEQTGLTIREINQQVLLVDIDQVSVGLLREISEYMELPHKIVGGDERERFV